MMPTSWLPFPAELSAFSPDPVASENGDSDGDSDSGHGLRARSSAMSREGMERLRQCCEADALVRLLRASEGFPLGDPLVYASPAEVSQARVNVRAAEDALSVVTTMLHDRATSFKSTNKWAASQPSPPVPARRPLDWSLLQGALTDDRERRDRFDIAENSVNAWTRANPNCSGLAIAVQDYLGIRCPTLQTSYVGFAADHAMAVVGSFDPDHAALPLERWPPHLIACDPWARVCCSAPDYPRRFRDKMRKWASEGKRLRIGSDVQWVSPTTPAWLACPDGIDTLLVRQQYTSGQVTLRSLFCPSPPKT